MTRPFAHNSADFPDAETLALALQLLQEASEENPDFSSARVDEVIRSVKGKRLILRGQLAGQPAVFRLYLTAVEDCARDWAELLRIWPYMDTGALRVCAPLGHAPKAGVMAVAHVAGTPLLKWIYGADLADRARHLVPAAKWLRAYTEGTESEAQAHPEGWAKRAERAAKAQAFNRLRRVEKPILKEIMRLVPRIEGSQWRHAISHGDFHPNNLIINGDCITGIDCGGSRPAPIYKDMARFLMHMGRRAVIPSGQMFLGVDAKGIDAFADAFELTQMERELTLPFFIAVEALLRAETRNLPQSRIRRARKMSEALLADLEQIGR